MPESVQDPIDVKREILHSPQLSGERESFRTRSLRITTGAAAGMTARLLSAGGNLVIIPLVLHALGKEQFGIWAVVMSFSAVSGFADLGLGNGLVNRLAPARHNESSPKSIVAAGFYSLVAAGFLVATLTLASYAWLPWASLFHVSISLAGPSRQAFLIWGCCTALSVPLSCAQKIQLAWEENERIGAWQGLSALLALASTFVASRLSPSLPVFVFAVSGAQTITLLANHMVEFYVRRPWLCPMLPNFHLRFAQTIASSGVKLAVLQALGFLGFFCDSLLITHTHGPIAAAKYSVVTRVFLLVFLGQYFTAPLWSAFANAYAKREWDWMRTIFRRSILGALVVGLSTSGILIFAGPAIRLWVGTSMQPDLLLLAGFAAWNLIATLYVPITGLLSIDTFLWPQIRFFGLAGISAFVLKLFAVRSGASWVIWCADLSYSVVLIPTLLFIYRRYLVVPHE